MYRYTISAFVSLMILYCSSCDHKNKNDSYFLDKDYDFVLGFAVPDEDRLVPTEVFVGKLLDLAEEGELPEITDLFLWEQVRRYHSWYRARLDFHDDAEVYISSDNQKIKLQYVGTGVYRDVNDVLHIEPLKKYKLEVYRPGNRYYTSEVTVPGNFDFVNLHNGDTLGPYYPKRASDLSCLIGVIIPWTRSLLAQLYWTKCTYDSGSIAIADVKYAKGVTFATDKVGVNAVYRQIDPTDTLRFFKYEVFAFDTVSSRFYQKDGVALTRELDSFLTYWDQTVPIYKRSGLNTHGHDDAIGNFSSYNAARVNFYVWGKKDSCGF